MTLHLQGVVRADHPVSADASAHVVGWYDLAVLVRSVPDGHALTRGEAVHHLERLGHLVRQGPVVPLRFGTMAQDEDAVRADVLQPAANQLRDQLKRFDGLAEAHVYLSFDENAALSAVLRESPNTVQPGHTTLAGRISAGERIAQQVVAWRKAQADRLLASVSALARESISLPEHEHTRDRRALLLALEDIPTVEAYVTKLKTEARTAEFVGPLPAFSFLAAGAPRMSASRWGW